MRLLDLLDIQPRFSIRNATDRYRGSHLRDAQRDDAGRYALASQTLASAQVPATPRSYSNYVWYNQIYQELPEVESPIFRISDFGYREYAIFLDMERRCESDHIYAVASGLLHIARDKVACHQTYTRTLNSAIANSTGWNQRHKLSEFARSWLHIELTMETCVTIFGDYAAAHLDSLQYTSYDSVLWDYHALLRWYASTHPDLGWFDAHRVQTAQSSALNSLTGLGYVV
jgi:hypothetical protein